jgi:hypothetical protein
MLFGTRSDAVIRAWARWSHCSVAVRSCGLGEGTASIGLLGGLRLHALVPGAHDNIISSGPG